MRSFVAVASLLALGCRPQPPVAALSLDAPLPDLAAEFRTVITTGGGSSTVAWRVWRRADEIVVENLTERVADHWQRDGEFVFRRMLFHDERRGVEFQPGDLQFAQPSVPWLERGLLFPPELLTLLRAEGSGWRDGRPYRTYAGDLEGVRWRLTLGVDLLLPLEIEKRTAARAETTKLVSVFTPTAAAPWEPLATADYVLVDFADLGDLASDPFASRVESRLGLAPAHREH